MIMIIFMADTCNNVSHFARIKITICVLVRKKWKEKKSLEIFQL